MVQKYIGQKKGVRHNTQANYDFVINIIKKEEFGTRRIDKIKLSDAKAWFIKLQADGRGYSSIHSVRGIVRPAFQMAVEVFSSATFTVEIAPITLSFFCIPKATTSTPSNI